MVAQLIIKFTGNVREDSALALDDIPVKMTLHTTFFDT